VFLLEHWVGFHPANVPVGTLGTYPQMFQWEHLWKTSFETDANA